MMKGRKQMKKWYTNLADSVIGSTFSLHGAVVENGWLGDKTRDMMSNLERVFEFVSAEKNQPCQIIFTLNQVADNPVLITDDAMIEQFCRLFQNDIAKITTYTHLDIITYVQQRLSSAIQRIYKNKNTHEEGHKLSKSELDELRFISSLFPRLGQTSFTRTKTPKLRLALGDMYRMGIRNSVVREIHDSLDCSQTDLMYDKLQNIVTDYIETHEDMRFGYFTALQKIFVLSSNPEQQIGTIALVDDFSEEEQQYFRHIMRNLFKLDNASRKSYIENDTFIKDYVVDGVSQSASLCKVIRSFLNNDALFSEKVELWLQELPNKYEKYKDKLRDLLRMSLNTFSQMNSGRSAMYNRIGEELETCESLKSLFKLPVDHHNSPKKIAEQIIRMAIDWTYNIHNAFLCSREGRIIEREYTSKWPRQRDEYEGCTIEVTAIVDAKYTIREGILIRESRKEIEL